jgi:gliding motility associated protien GldN
MKKIIVVIFLFTFLGSSAQVLDPEYGPRAWKKENAKQEVAVTLTHIREADVMWSKRIWRTIDLRQKENLPLYYPLKEVTLGKRSFVQIIYDLLKDPNYDLKAYSTYELMSEIPNEEALGMFAIAKEFDSLYVDDAGICQGKMNNIYRQDFQKVKPQITKIMLMEDWFFDKQRSVMDVRILALAIEIPISKIKEKQVYCDGIGQNLVVYGDWEFAGGTSKVWFFFPDLRDALASNECYKRHNDAARITFDDIFLKRTFQSYITREENVYDRFIDEYKSNLEALLEAEKIKEDMRNLEMNLWQY